MAKSKKPKAARKRTPRTTLPAQPAPEERLLNDLRTLIDATRDQVARTVNSALVGLYWHIGKRTREDVLKEQRAEYGQQIVNAVRSQSTQESGQGFRCRNLVHMSTMYPNGQNVSALIRQLSWTHAAAQRAPEKLARQSERGSINNARLPTRE
jgi:hypothetical protein